MPYLIPTIPDAVKAALDRLKNDLTRTAGSNFAGLILYGGLARGRFRPGRSDVNVVLLLQDTSPIALKDVAPALRAARRMAGVVPITLTPDETTATATSFPIKFLDIKHHHIVLAGVDPFRDLEIPAE